MNTNRVEQDKENYRNQTLSRTSAYNDFSKIVLAIAFLSLSLTLGGKFIYPQPQLLTFFVITLITGISILGPLIFTIMNHSRQQLNLAYFGYNINWKPNTGHIFGYHTYTLIRADPGHYHSYTTYGTPASLYSIENLKQIETTQRNNAQCEICNKQPFENGLADSNGAYFVEQRKHFWLFWIPLSDTLVQWNAYCSNHKPTQETVEFDTAT